MTETEKNAFILIRRRLASSRADIARMLNISRPTASNAVQSLLDANMIVECGKGKSNGGTAPISLAVNARSACYIGIDLGYTDRMAAVLLDNAGTIIEQSEVRFSPEDINDIEKKLCSVTEFFSKNHSASGIAVALSGIVDETNMNVLKSINLNYCKNTIAEILKKNFELPFYIGNRSRMAALSEAFGGAGDRETDFAVISLGKSIGAAFWCAGEIFNGKNYSAGEIRNMRLADGRTFENALAPHAVKNLSAENIAGLCAEGLVQLADIMDIDLMILSGRFADYGENFAAELEKIISYNHPVKVRSACFGRFSAARGAAFKMGEIIF